MHDKCVEHERYAIRLLNGLAIDAIIWCLRDDIAVFRGKTTFCAGFSM